MVYLRSTGAEIGPRLVVLVVTALCTCPVLGQDAGPAATSAPAAKSLLPAVRLTDAGLLDLHVRDLELSTLLEMLSYQARANIVSSTKVSGRVSANLYSVSLEQALDAILIPNHYAYFILDKTVFVGTEEEIRAMRPPPTTRVFKLRYVRPDDAAKALKAVLANDAVIIEGGTAAGGGAQGGGTGSGGGGGKLAADMGSTTVDYLIVTDYPDRLNAAEMLLAEIDQRPKQVLVEATVLRATLNESNQFGVDFTILGGVDFQNVNSTSNASADLHTGQLPPNKFQDETVNVNTQFTGNITGGGFTIGVVNNGVAAFVRALEDVTDVVVVGNPKVIALNKQEADVIVGRRDGYLTTTVTATAAIQTVDFLETGTQIRFRPIINDDGTVRMAVHPKDSNGGLTAANLPFEETTEAHADVLVDDGDTVLIGGLFRERTVGSKSQIPLVGDIPLLGLAFGSHSNQTIREEVIILLTVHVIKETEQEQAANRELLEDVERVRVGIRQGLMATGRERLAQAFFHAALADVEHGHPALALLNARMALHNQPKHLAAFKLKERLLHERLWDDEGTRMRTFIWDLIRAERPAGAPEPPTIFGRPRLDDQLGPTNEPPAGESFP
jgi:type II secretory pathway component GspD/PulD (secretin)